MVVFSAVGIASVAGQLIHAEFTGPLTLHHGGNLNFFGPEVGIGSRLDVAFTYDSRLQRSTPRGGGEDDGAVYDNYGGERGSGSLRLGDYFHQIDTVSVALFRDIEQDGVTGDLMQLAASDVPIGRPNRFGVWATLIYPPGTLGSLELTAPPSHFILGRLSFTIDDMRTYVQAESSQVSLTPPYMTPIPEPGALTGLASVGLLILVVARTRRCLKNAAVDSDPNGSRRAASSTPDF